MKKNTKSMMAIICSVLLISMIFAPVVFAEEMTIQGKVSGEGTIITDAGDEYTIADNDQGEKLMDNVDKKVSAVGTVSEQEGKKIITVNSYELMEE